MIQSFGQIFEIIDGDRGKNYPQDKDFSESGYCLFLSAANVTKDGWRFDSNQFITKEKCDILRKGLISRGDIVFTTRGTVGNVAFYDDTIPYETVRINSGMIILRGKGADIISNKFAYYILRSKFVGKIITYYCSGSAQPQLPIKDFSKIKVDLPALDTQKRIVSILSNYDTLIDINTKRIKLLEESARELYKEWFVRMRFPGHEKTKFVKGIPEGWKYMRIDEFAVLCAGGDKPKDFSEFLTDDYRVPVFSNGITNDGLQGYTRIARILEPSVTVSARGTIGFVRLREEPYVPIVRLVVLIPKKNRVSLTFLYHLINSLPILGTGASQEQLTVPDFSKVKVLIPTKNLTDDFSKIVKPFYLEMNLLRKTNRELAATRDRLLPRLLSGELKVKA